MEFLTSPEIWVTLLTLTVLEIILGIDNIVMIAVLVSKLPEKHQVLARSLGIGFALLTRVLLLITLKWLVGLTEPLFHLGEHPFSVRDIVMFVGGFFLLYKGAHELHALTKVEEETTHKLMNSVHMVVLQIGFFDIVFSLDSVLTAVSLAEHLPVMITAIVIAMAVMLFASGPVIKVINKYVSIKVLALTFIVVIGIMLLVSAFGVHVPKTYLYSAMGFSALVEGFIIFITAKREKAGLD
jgi:predicted tellurium resistance membrane protein TerC